MYLFRMRSGIEFTISLSCTVFFTGVLGGFCMSNRPCLRSSYGSGTGPSESFIEGTWGLAFSTFSWSEFLLSFGEQGGEVWLTRRVSLSSDIARFKLGNEKGLELLGICLPCWSTAICSSFRTFGLCLTTSDRYRWSICGCSWRAGAVVAVKSRRIYFKNLFRGLIRSVSIFNLLCVMLGGRDKLL